MKFNDSNKFLRWKFTNFRLYLEILSLYKRRHYRVSDFLLIGCTYTQLRVKTNMTVISSIKCVFNDLFIYSKTFSKSYMRDTNIVAVQRIKTCLSQRNNVRLACWLRTGKPLIWYRFHTEPKLNSATYRLQIQNHHNSSIKIMFLYTKA